ncbi:PIN domain-containing protein [uncultured Algimonas sp.]|uniref:PIN domain-containing protein n=1 Tax=uncultured Algimonas sp. TaxID=1547920 RepID=UPI00261C60E6|nr:PIN domain-containing protein [uncultured Algimonas sp.]
MTPDCLLDTNVLLYAALHAEDAPEKWERAREIVAEENYSTSGQVLAEFYTNATNPRKFDKPLSSAIAAKWIAALSMKPCAEVDSAVVMQGIQNAMQFKISYWDGAVIAATEALGAPVLYSEDLNHGQHYGAVRVIDPFKPHPDFN